MVRAGAPATLRYRDFIQPGGCITHCIQHRYCCRDAAVPCFQQPHRQLAVIDYQLSAHLQVYAFRTRLNFHTLTRDVLRVKRKHGFQVTSRYFITAFTCFRAVKDG